MDGSISFSPPKSFHPRRLETQPVQLPAHPDLFRYAPNTVSSFRAMEHKIQEDYCNETSCLLGMSLQSHSSASEVQKSSLTLTIACLSAPPRRPEGNWGSPFALILVRFFSLPQMLCLSWQRPLASEHFHSRVKDSHCPLRR